MTKKQQVANRLYLNNYGPITLIDYTIPKVPTSRSCLKNFKGEMETLKLLLTDSFQCFVVGVNTRKVTIFILGCRPGFIDGSSVGLYKQEWSASLKAVKALLLKYFNRDFPMYIEDWSAARKFQARLEFKVKL